MFFNFCVRFELLNPFEVTAGSVAGRVIDEIRSIYKCNKCGKTIDG